MKQDKTGKRIAILDLGSNTFHLLIVDVYSSRNEWVEVYRERQFVYLSKDGLGHFKQDTIDRASAALQKFKAVSIDKGVVSSTVVGTSALRHADNGFEIINVAKSLDYEVEVISGKREAELIFEGVMFSIKYDDPLVIMDIGGGSVEFILVKNKQSIESISVKSGISYLRKTFSLSDPLSKIQIEKVKEYLKFELADFLSIAHQIKPSYLVGASGPFEILESIFRDGFKDQKPVLNWNEVQLFVDKLLSMDLNARNMYPGMPAKRADLSKESFLLIQIIMELIPNLKNIHISPHSLKEGLIKTYF